MIILSLLHTSYNSDRFTQLFTFQRFSSSFIRTPTRSPPEANICSSSPPTPFACLHPSSCFLLLHLLQPQKAHPSPAYPGSLCFSPCWELITSIMPLTPSSIFNLLSISLQIGSVLSNPKIKTKKPKLKPRYVPQPRDFSTSLLSFTAQLLIRIVYISHLQFPILPLFFYLLQASPYLLQPMKDAVIRHISNPIPTKIFLAFSVTVFCF